MRHFLWWSCGVLHPGPHGNLLLIYRYSSSWIAVDTVEDEQKSAPTTARKLSPHHPLQLDDETSSIIWRPSLYRASSNERLK